MALSVLGGRRPLAPKARSLGLVNCEDCERRRSRPLWVSVVSAREHRQDRDAVNGNDGGTAQWGRRVHKRAVGAPSAAVRSGPASALSDLVDHKGQPQSQPSGLLGERDALLGGLREPPVACRVSAGTSRGCQAKAVSPAPPPGRHHQPPGQCDGDLRRDSRPVNRLARAAKRTDRFRGKAMELLRWRRPRRAWTARN